GKHLRAPEQSAAVWLSHRAALFQRRCNAVESLQDYREDQNRVQDGGLQRDPSPEPWRPRHGHPLIYIWPSVISGVARWDIRSTGSDLRPRQWRSPGGTRAESHILRFGYAGRGGCIIRSALGLGDPFVDTPKSLASFHAFRGPSVRRPGTGSQRRNGIS